MALLLRFIDGVDPRLRYEMQPYVRWLRRWYDFPVTLHMRLIHRDVLVDDDGSRYHLRWWQHDRHRPVTVEIAVGKFARNLAREGPTVAYPTVAAAIARGLKYYRQATRDAPIREDYADRFADKVIDAYVADRKPPRL